MAMNIRVISKEMIKPSSQTPPDLSNLKLSFLDQMAPPNYIPLILFYPSEFKNNDIENASRSLKQSLAQNLTRFYPLAGRLSDDGISIDCNDAGVEYVECRVEGQLIADIIKNPDMEELTKFLPINPFDHTNNVVLLAIQVNFFACGGLALAVCMCHKIGDGSSMASFIKSWASQSLGNTEEIPDPDFDSACKLFPPIDLCGFTSKTGLTQERVITKRLVFDKMKIARLKEKMTTTKITPTRVEAVSAFIWKKMTDVSEAKESNILGNSKKLYIGAHAANLRSKTSPPLLDSAFGNIYCSLSAIWSVGDSQNLVQKLRDAIRGINEVYVKTLENGNEYMEMYKKINETFAKGGGNIEICAITSWCRFPFYEVDYGWGKPVWVCITTIPLKNFVVFMSTKDGNGIEAWVSLVEADMSALEADYSLL